jgi:D-xylonolactonase
MDEDSSKFSARIIANYQNECGESPLWNQESGTLFWTDCVGNRFLKYVPATDYHCVVKSGLQINRCLLKARGGFVVANNDGLWIWDGQGEMKFIVGEVDGVKLQFNEAMTDARGRVFAGTCYYSPNSEYPLGHLVRIDNDGRANILDEGFHLANGIAFSPDDRTLYCTDSVARRIYAYDFDVEDGTISNRRTMIQLGDNEGLPDGLAVDTRGNLWSAQWYGSVVICYDSTGIPVQKVPVPAKQVSSVAFGGADRSTLFITTAAKPEPMPVMPEGYDPYSGDIGGALFAVDTSSVGLNQRLANFV